MNQFRNTSCAGLYVFFRFSLFSEGMSMGGTKNQCFYRLF